MVRFMSNSWSFFRARVDQLHMSYNASYLFFRVGVILESKLNWNIHIDNRIRKASKACWQCRRAIGKPWGLKPKVVYWICNIHFGNQSDVDLCRIS
jgi:hypothetical protein